jgi:ribonuclease P protein component
MATGTRRRTGDLVLIKATGQDDRIRVGLVAGKRIGNAVLRNRAKRRLRQAVKLAGLADGNDYVVVAGRSVIDAAYPKLVASLRELAASLGGDGGER